MLAMSFPRLRCPQRTWKLLYRRVTLMSTADWLTSLMSNYTAQTPVRCHALVHYTGCPKKKVNFLGGHSIGHSKQKSLYEHVCYSKRLLFRIPSQGLSLFIPLPFIYKVHPRTGHVGTQGKLRYSSTLSLTSALDGSEYQCHDPASNTHERNQVRIVQEAG